MTDATIADNESVAAIAHAHFGPSWVAWLERLGSPLSAHLIKHVAQDPDLLALLTNARAGQPLAMLFLNSVQYLLREQRDDPLARYYAVLTDEPLPLEDVFPHFRRFCIANESALRELVNTKTLQYTGLERAFGVMLALSEVETRIGGPFPLIEIGSSAGLLLAFDRFAYDFGAAGRLGPINAPATSALHFVGAPPPMPARMPQVSSRVGIDLAPIRADDRDAVRWLASSYLPEWVGKAANLERAIAACAHPPLDLVEANALLVIDELAGRSRGPLCIMHAHVLYQWTDEMVRELDEKICGISQLRPVYRISVESKSMRPEDLANGRESGTKGPCIELITYHQGVGETEQLGQLMGDEPNLGIRWDARVHTT